MFSTCVACAMQAGTATQNSHVKLVTQGMFESKQHNIECQETKNTVLLHIN